MRYELTQDGMITMVADDVPVKGPWFVSLTAAAVHSGVPVTCFTKEGVRADAFPNPLPDPRNIDPEAFPEKRHYFVQMTHEGYLHNPPLMPEQAKDWTAFIVGDVPVFDYEPENISFEL